MLILATGGFARAETDRASSTATSATRAPSEAPLVVAATLGARVQLTSEATLGVATYVGTRYSLVGHEGWAEVAATVAAAKHLGATLVSAEASYAHELDDDQSDADLALSALRAVGARAAVGVAGHATIDLDAGRSDGAEVRWEAQAGPAATLRFGRAALILQSGAVALATPVTTKSGAFAMATVGGWF